ncbi:TIGR03016 family PEP-CTERM system-associated outer membrane protein [Thioalkalivibrio sp. XN279]|uniref:TIGR03016 family PEP-CTERM system-associated outer membrane protein n=1 Tax=Thioalkalivibrio sp. XN279 TaxID=2714953 RepID=UPI00140C8008|nr:TIGR03016 family PEP-CTERM system-associated outer membrane protein [Thioalkalivibrio sp. XN279]NHA15386.1 TIGR03016 family PEP-CTERM system-associated outer membrane protein [Thioalkalivibrio sp. XN279]
MGTGRTQHRRRAKARLLALSVAALCAAPPATAADWKFEPRASLGLTWLDNVDLAPSGLEESETILELKPGFSVVGASPRVDARLDYDAQGLWFADNDDLDDIYHQALGRGTFELLERQLFLDGFLRFDQQNIDPARSLVNSNLFNTGNRADTFVYSVSPYHVGRWGEWGESLLRLQHQGVRYSNFDENVFNLEDSETNSASASLGSPRERRGFSWRLSGSTATTEYDAAPDFAYDRAALDIGVPVGLRTRLTATAGQESDVVTDRTAGGLDESFWFVGVEWQPSERETLEARVGDRFYGSAYELRWTRRGSRGELGVEYTEEPTTASGVLGEDGGFQPDFGPGGTPQLDTRVFLRKRFSARASYELVRSTIAARVFGEERDYQDQSGDTERNYGVGLDYDWQLAARMRAGLRTEWERRDFADPAGEDDFWELTASLSREITRTLSGVLSASHFRRDSAGAEDYDVNRVSLSVQARF